MPADLVTGRVVSTIDTATMPGRVANLLSKRAATDFGVTGDLFTMSDYAVPQDWAQALRTIGHEGLHYTPRFSPHGKAIAVFGPEGARPGSVTDTRTLREVLDTARVQVIDTPASTALTFVSPPR